MNTARIGDITAGICCCHPPIPCIGTTGIIITGDMTNIDENSPTSRISDIVVGSCGHIGIIVSGSGTNIDSNLSTARIGDAVAGCLLHTIVSGAGTLTDY